MLLIQGQIRDNTGTDQAIETIRRQIPVTLGRGDLTLDEVLCAADRLAREVLSGQLDKLLSEYLSTENSLAGRDIHQIAESFLRENLQKKWNLELGHLPAETASGKRLLRMPLGVLLHISAGNVDALPAYSVLEGLMAGNINLLKLPSMDNGLSLFLLQKLIHYEEKLKDYIYVFDTPSSDLPTIRKSMELARGIVVWGSDEAVQAVREQAPISARIIEWGHKLSFVYLQDPDLPLKQWENLAEHILSIRQLLCSSCQVVYVNTEDFGVVCQVGERLAEALRQQEDRYPVPLPIQGKIAVEQMTQRLEGFYDENPCLRNSHSSVTCMQDSELELSMQFGNVYVKPLPNEKLIDVLWQHRSHLQTAGIYPCDESLIQMLAAAGVTRICPLDQMSRMDLLESHDGSFALQQYSRMVEVG